MADTDKREPLSAEELEAIARDALGRRLLDEHIALRGDYAMVLAERDALQAQCTQLTREHAAQRERIAELERERDEARAEVERLDGRRREMRQLLARLVKYATEDRAVTPGFTRLARCVAQVSDYLARTSEPADVLRSAPAPQPPAEPKREPVAVEPRADAPLEVAALAHWWDEQRRREGKSKSHLSYCAAELRRARDAEMEGLKARVTHLEDRLDYERNPSAYNVAAGHEMACNWVVFPRASFPCNCTKGPKP